MYGELLEPDCDNRGMTEMFTHLAEEPLVLYHNEGVIKCLVNNTFFWKFDTPTIIATFTLIMLTLNNPVHTNIYTIIFLKSVCQRSQTAGRNSCSIVSGNVSNCSHRLTVYPVTNSRLNSA